MTVSRIIGHFEAVGRLPVSLSDVVEQFRHCILDAGLRVTASDGPADVLRGVHYRRRFIPRPDSAVMAGDMIHIVYSRNQPLPWQRLVCCKELVHVLDNPRVKTQSKEDVIALVRKLSSNDKKVESENDLQRFFDDLAIYQALAILFPFSFREEVISRYREGRISADRLAEIAVIPVEYISAIMSDEWQFLREQILANT